jgi:hypothetical protein
MTTDYKEYSKIKKDFFKKHSLKKVDTSSMNEYGTYHKEYICEDGAIFYEVMEPEYCRQVVEFKGVPIEVEAKLFRTEYWSSDNVQSKYCYEKF